MKQNLGLGLLVLCVIYGTKEAWGRPLGSEELREERLAMLRRIIEDMTELIYVNDLYEDGKLGGDIDLETYLNSISDTMKSTDKRKMPRGFSAVRGKRPHVFSAVRGKRPHTFSAVRGKRDPMDVPFYIPEGSITQGLRDMEDDSDKRNAPSGFSFVRGKKDLSGTNNVEHIENSETQTDEHSLAKKSERVPVKGAEVATEENAEQKRNGKMDYLFQQ